MSELSFSLLCFNVDKKFSSISYLNEANVDLYLLQEVDVNGSLPGSSGHKAVCLQEKGKNMPYNCIVYNSSKFNIISSTCTQQYEYGTILWSFINYWLTDYKKYIKLENRACVAILEYIGDSSDTWNPRIIIVCFHNPYRDLGEGDTRTKLASQFFKAVRYLGVLTGYPVLVGGDFNCELLKHNVDTRGFIVPPYNPTIHRALIDSRGNSCIDFFAYKNYSGCTKIEVSDVHAELVIPPTDGCLVKGTGGQYNLDYKECKYITDKENAESSLTLMCNYYLSNHNPLRSTLTVKFKLPALTISYYNRNNDRKPIEYTGFGYDLVINHNVDASQKVNMSGYEHINMFASTIFSYKKFKLHSFSAPKIFSQTKFKSRFSILGLTYEEKSDLKVIFAFITKSTTNSDTDVENEDFIKIINQYRDEKSCHTIIIMGDFNPTEVGDLPLILPSDIRLDEEDADKCFIAVAYMDNDKLEDGILAHLLDTKPAGPHHVHQAQLSFHCHINVLYLNMEGTDKKSISSYLTELNPKPNLFIFYKSQNIELEKRIFGSNSYSTDETTDCSRIVYNDTLFQVVEKIQFDNPVSCKYTITGWKIKCLKIVGTPELIVASFNNFTSNTTSAEMCFKLLNIFKCPILIAGGFNVELDTLKAKYGFEIPQCDPTISRVLKVAKNKDLKICRDFFAHRSGGKICIKLENVHAETIIPSPGLVTGSGGYNIDYDQGIRKLMITDKHDPIRAKLTITYTSLALKSSSVSKPSTSKQPLASTSSPVSKLSTPTKQPLPSTSPVSKSSTKQPH